MKHFGGRRASVRTSLLVALNLTITVFCRPAVSQIQTVQVTGGEIQGEVKNGVASFQGDSLRGAADWRTALEAATAGQALESRPERRSAVKSTEWDSE